MFIIATTASADTTIALDTAKIEQLTGLKGTYSQDENVFKIAKPRTDVKVQADHVLISPFLGLTSWAAFTPLANGKTMMMGDTVVFEDEVNPAMSAALDAGLEVTALHNHFFFDQPKVYFMHIGGVGSVQQLALGLKQVYDKIAAIRAANAIPATGLPGRVSTINNITAAPLEKIFGKKGDVKDGMFKVSFGRKATMNGVEIGNQMGVNTWAAFAGSDNEAVVDGDFAMQENELQTVLKTMRAQGINIVAIHQHMVQENPRIIFMHYWGKGKAENLANSVKKVLNAQAAMNK